MPTFSEPDQEFLCNCALCTVRRAGGIPTAEDMRDPTHCEPTPNERDLTKKDTNPKDAIGITKPPLSVVPMPVLYEVALGLLEGACKYRRHNYRVAGVRASVYYDATMRHLNDWWEGQDIDPKSGIHHVSKAIASLFVLRDAMMCGKLENDDRPPPSPVGWMDQTQALMDELMARYPNPEPPYTKDDV